MRSKFVPEKCPRIYELARFMMERENVRKRREAGQEKPWTQDKILQNNRFCNVYREDDTVTRWIEENIRQPYKNHPHLWFMLCIARYINWPPTLAQLIEMSERQNVPTWPSHPKFNCGESYLETLLSSEPFHASAMTWALTQMAKRGDKVYTSAYMIRAESNPKANWYSWSKHKYIVEIVLGRLWEDREKWAQLLEPDTSLHKNDISAREALTPNLKTVWEVFQDPRYIGWGPFMAYEVVTDMRHTRYLEHAQDIYTWANAGPGAIRGLNRLYGRCTHVKPRPEQTNAEMMELMFQLNELGGEDFLVIPNGADSDLFARAFGLATDDPPRFEMRDIEHCLCEFDKYERVRLGEGQMRSKYNGRG